MSKSVRELSKQMGISMLELTEKSGLDIVKVRAICQGRWTPSPEERQRIAKVLDTSVDDISWGHKTPIQHIYGHGPD